jgi:hypothetical protein
MGTNDLYLISNFQYRTIGTIKWVNNRLKAGDMSVLFAIFTSIISEVKYIKENFK